MGTESCVGVSAISVCARVVRTERRTQDVNEAQRADRGACSASGTASSPEVASTCAARTKGAVARCARETEAIALLAVVISLPRVYPTYATLSQPTRTDRGYLSRRGHVALVVSHDSSHEPAPARLLKTPLKRGRGSRVGWLVMRCVVF